MPHAPQLSRSVSRVAHVPLQSFCVAGQDTEHLPATHTSPAPHALPHAPQFSRSSLVSTQVEPHNVCPVVQLAASTAASAGGVAVSLPLEHAGTANAPATVRTSATNDLQFIAIPSLLRSTD